VIRALRVLGDMASLLSDTTLPLTLSEQLNAMLSGWLDRHAPDGDLGDADQTAAGIVTVANAHVPEVQAFCAQWDMTVSPSASRDGRHAVLIVQGRPLAVRGFVEITSMYRR
jgi:hypothetical protein